jgi:hypothetical protein
MQPDWESPYDWNEAYRRQIWSRHRIADYEVEEALEDEMGIEASLLPVNSRDEIPAFANEAEERAFWDTHCFGEEMLRGFKRRGPAVRPSAEYVDAREQRKAGQPD